MTWTDALSDLTCVTVDEVDDRIALVTLDRPDRLNAITPRLVEELERVVVAVDLDPTLRAVVMTGAGRGFCSGLDLQGADSTPPGAEDVSPTVRGFMGQDQIATLNEHIHRSRKPWVAAVNGACVGGGFAIALACDIRVAARSATFGAVFLKIGVSNCDMGTSYFLPRFVGASRAAELLLTASSAMRSTSRTAHRSCAAPTGRSPRRCGPSPKDDLQSGRTCDRALISRHPAS